MLLNRTLLVVFVLLGISRNLFSQVGIGTNSPHASSVLEVSSTTKGFLPPRLTEAERQAITDPATGLLIYNKNINCLEVFIGSAGNSDSDWKSLCSSGAGTPGTGGGIVTDSPDRENGSVSISTQTCFDIAESNDFANGCGSLSSRTASKANFAQQTTYEQTLTISTNTAVSNLVLAVYNSNGNPITAVSQPVLTSLDATGTNSSTTATITYNQNLNTDANGLSTDDAYTATIFLTYEENGKTKRSELNITVQDCECSKDFASDQANYTSVFLNNKGKVFTAGRNVSTLAAGRNISTNAYLSDFEKVDTRDEFDNKVFISNIATGADHSIAVSNKGKLYGFGSNGSYKLGLGDLANYPIKLCGIPLNERVVDISLAPYHSYVLTHNNKIYRTGGVGTSSTGEMSKGVNVGIGMFKYLDLSDTVYANQNGGVLQFQLMWK